jgi:hypothetical protein
MCRCGCSAKRWTPGSRRPNDELAAPPRRYRPKWSVLVAARFCRIYLRDLILPARGFRGPAKIIDFRPRCSPHRRAGQLFLCALADEVAAGALIRSSPRRLQRCVFRRRRSPPGREQPAFPGFGQGDGKTRRNRPQFVRGDQPLAPRGVRRVSSRPQLRLTRGGGDALPL